MFNQKLKVLVSICLSLGASVVLAATVGPQSSWQEIQSAGLTFDMPRIGFGTIFVPVTNVCKDGNDLKTLRPVEVCVQTGHGQQSTDCGDSKAVMLKTSAFYQTKECTRWASQHECVESSMVTKAFLTEYRVSVYRPALNQHGPGGAMSQLTFTKPFLIPSCSVQ